MKMLISLSLLMSASAFAAPSWAPALDAELAKLSGDDTQLYRLRGLDPAFYEEKLRAEPEVARDLKRRIADKSLHPAHAIAHLLRKLDTHTYSKKNAALERAQLEDGLIVAISTAQYPLVDDALIFVSNDPARSPRAQELALVRLGFVATDDARAHLLRNARAGVAPERRAAALIGLSHRGDSQAIASARAVLGDKGARTSLHPSVVRAFASVLSNDKTRASLEALTSALAVEDDATLAQVYGLAIAKQRMAETREVFDATTFETVSAQKVAKRTLRMVERRLDRRR